jgi:transcriptional regulator with XRE-family HTH domain
MSGRRRAVTLGEARGREALTNLCRELDDAIRNQGLSYATVAADVGLSPSQVSRIARGGSPDLSIVQAAVLLASVGLDLSVKTYPTGRPVRDRAHLALLERLRIRLHRSLTWRTEVPVVHGAHPSDLRAWDAVIAGHGWTSAVEAEVRLRDLQALDRRIALKLRDGSVDSVLLLVWNTRTNRDVLREFGAALRPNFPMSGRRALELLQAGVHPGSNALILL